MALYFYIPSTTQIPYIIFTYHIKQNGEIMVIVVHNVVFFSLAKIDAVWCWLFYWNKTVQTTCRH